MSIKSLPVYSLRAGNTRPTKATVYPKNGGTPYTGYVIDGKTYKDSDGKTRIDYGSRVELGDGRTYIYNRGTGGVPDRATAMREYRGNVQNMIDSYRESGKYHNDAVDAAYRKTRAKATQDKQRARELYSTQVSDARGRYIEASNPYGPVGQRLSALGLGDSGYAENTYAKLGNDYQNAVSKAGASLAETLRTIDGEITRAYYDGEIEKAKAWQQIEQDIMNRSSDFSYRYATMMNEAADEAEDNERRDREWEYKISRDRDEDARDAREDTYSWAMDMIKLGISSPEIARALNLPEATAAGIAAGYRKTGKTAAKKSTSSKTTAKSTSQKTDAKGKGQAESPALSEAEQQANLDKFNIALRNILYQEGIIENRDIRETFYSLLNIALEKGLLTPEQAKKLKPPTSEYEMYM